MTGITDYRIKPVASQDHRIYGLYTIGIAIYYSYIF